MTRIEEIEANVAKAKIRQDVNDSGLLAVLIASDIPYLLAEVKRMREALECMSGAFDTPIARRRIDNPTANEARIACRAALKGTQS